MNMLNYNLTIIHWTRSYAIFSFFFFFLNHVIHFSLFDKNIITSYTLNIITAITVLIEGLY